MTKQKLDSFFDPISVAVVGASGNPVKAGYIILKNLMDKRYQGRIYPINPGSDTILGLKSYPVLSQVPDEIELVVLITPAALIDSMMDDLETRMAYRGDVKALVCAAADYGETKTAEGIRRHNRLLAACGRYGIRVLGPNCIGVINNANGVDTTFVDSGMPLDAYKTRSGISVISQSGSVATSIIMMGAARPEPVVFNKFASIGNMADVDFIDLLEYYESDNTTRVIGIYMEGYSKGQRLVEMMGRIARKKPVVVLKVGRGQKGARAASSHTGSLAGADAVYDAAFKQYGIIRAETFSDLIDTLLTLERCPLPRGNNFYILSQTGGFGIFCTDNVEKVPGISMPALTNDTKTELRRTMPVMSAIDEPEGYSDVTVAVTEEQHGEALAAVLRDPGVDGVFFLTVTPSYLSQKKLGECIRDAYYNLPDEYRKPVWFCIMAGNYVYPSRQVLEAGGLCTYDTPAEAVTVVKSIMEYAAYLRAKEETNEH